MSLGQEYLEDHYYEYYNKETTFMAITIKDVRFSYCNLFQPQARQGQEPKYSVTILVPKTNTAAKALCDQAVAQAIEKGVVSKWGGVRPPQLSICIHDGDGVRPTDGQPYGEECKGCWVLSATSKLRPYVVDAQVQDILDPTQVYSGMYGNVSVNFFPYNSNGKKGIGCGLNGVQKVRDGEPLDGRVTAEEMFQAVASLAATGVCSADIPATLGAAYSAGSPYSAGFAVDPITGMPITGR